jgi:hypothetical protein
MKNVALSLAAALLCLASAAHAQATRTWVSGVGDDANPCSRTAPCKTFAGAISKTAPSGEINVLDPGGFGAVTITKALSIVNDGAIAGVLVSGTNAIIINAGVNDAVTLRGLDINGLGTGLNGIRFIAGKALHVQNTRIYCFQQGIDFEPNQLSAQLEVQDTNLSENSGNGILVLPAVGGSAKVSVDHVHSTNNSGDGFKSDATNGSISATLRESVFTANGGNGIHSFSPGASASILMVDHCSTQNHSSNSSASVGNGIFSDTGSGSSVLITDNTISGNRVGVFSSGSATMTSFGNNHNNGNGTNGTPNP